MYLNTKFNTACESFPLQIDLCHYRLSSLSWSWHTEWILMSDNLRIKWNLIATKLILASNGPEILAYTGPEILAFFDTFGDGASGSAE
mmetsp:Transcript_28010/g.67497  ORF Transcript_28010/g.67497 Transcript_28010/m.67497 type:complete len:88 (-) Transcript_28010:2-265(-)